MSFIDRVGELKTLKERVSSSKAEFMVVYGRRRVGKSELINELLKDSFGIKLLAREESEELQLKRFSEHMGAFFNDAVLQKNPLRNWDSFFTFIYERSRDRRVVIALDEFPYLVVENKAVPSVLQEYWDTKLKNSKICLIICGSSISMMEKILGHKSPLYGRRTSQLIVKPFTFKQIRGHVKRNLEDAINVYAIFGGTPAYILEYDIRKSLQQNLKEKVLKNDSFLNMDVEFVLKEELREPRYYFSILSAIAKGKTKVSEIINDTGIDKSIVGKYLSILSELMLVKREVPLMENPLKSRKGIYRLGDHFFRFWFRFVYPNKERIEVGDTATVLSIIQRDLSSYTGQVFEDICKESLEEMRKKGELAFSKLGRWWHKDKEIDMVAVNDATKEILFCECKWQDKVDIKKVIAALKEKAKFVDWNNGKRREKYCVFAKSFKEKTTDKELLLFDLADLEKMFV